MPDAPEYGRLGRFFCSALITAGGSGSRMGGEKPKQFIELDGVPAVARTLAVFEACPFIREIVVSARAGEETLYRELADRYGITKLTAVATGGETRQESALNGLKAVSDRSDFLLIHDAARCLVTERIIADTLAAAVKYGCAAAAHRSADTVKRADRSGFVAETLDRETIWLAQTPQVFQTKIYRAVAYYSAENGFEATDDCALAERVGYRVKLVECGSENLKLTYPEDVGAALCILRSSEEKAT